MDNHTLFQNFVTFTAAVHRVQHDVTKGAKPSELTALQYSMLEHIAVSHPLTPSDISDCFHMSLPNTSRELKKLVQKGLVEKRESEEDRRKMHIHLSKAGAFMMNEAFQTIEARFVERIGRISDEERDAIFEALNILHQKVFY